MFATRIARIAAFFVAVALVLPAATASDDKQKADPAAAGAVCSPAASDSDCASTLVPESGRLTARWTEQGVLLRWEAEPAEGRVGFRVLRQRAAHKEQADPTVLTPQVIPVTDNGLSKGAYEYLDRSKAGAGPMIYVVQQVDRNGKRETLETVSIVVPSPLRRRGASTRQAQEPEL